MTSELPFQGWGYNMGFQIVGGTVTDPSHRPSCFFKTVSPSYFRSLGIHLEKGRYLDVHDLKGSVPVTVINETMAKRYFGSDDPVGKQILIDKIAFEATQLGAGIPWLVVGVVADEKVGPLAESNDYSPGVYVTNEQSPQTYQQLLSAARPILLSCCDP